MNRESEVQNRKALISEPISTILRFNAALMFPDVDVVARYHLLQDVAQNIAEMVVINGCVSI